MHNEPRLALDVAMQLIGGKYKCWILYYLSGGAKRTGELAKLIHNISQKVLTEQLRQLQKNNLIHRQVYAQVPPKVKYELSELGLTFVPVLQVLCGWGKDYAQSQGIVVGSCVVFTD